MVSCTTGNQWLPVPYLYVMADDVPGSCGFSGLSSVPVRVTHYTFGGTTDSNRSGRVQIFKTPRSNSHTVTIPTSPPIIRHPFPHGLLSDPCDATTTHGLQRICSILYDTSCTVLWQSGPSSRPPRCRTWTASGRPLWRHVKAQAKSAASCKDAAHQRHMMIPPLDEEVPKLHSASPPTKPVLPSRRR